MAAAGAAVRPRRSAARCRRVSAFVFPMNKIPACLLTMVAWAAFAAAAPPNIVFILSDDVGYGDLGCFGATKVKTPNLDRLAREGMRFTDAHATASVCTPTRYAFVSGRYA